MQTWRLVLMFILLSRATFVEAGPIMLANGGFETLEGVGGGLPTTVGDWGGDDGQEIVTAEAGITPFEGEQMLAFRGADGFSSDVWQLVDVSLLDDAIDAGLVSVTVSVRVNRTAPETPTPEARFDMEFRVFGEVPSTLGEYDSLLLAPRVNFGLPGDTDPTTWEEIVGSLALPVSTRVFGVAISAQHRFSGEYADDVRLSVQVVSEPASLVLLSTGVVGLAALSWRRSLQRTGYARRTRDE